MLFVCSSELFTDEFNQILARKELNFEKMSDRDRKQIVAEVYVALEVSPLSLPHLRSLGIS